MSFCRRGAVAVLAAVWLGVFAASATAADPYEFNALYSLTGDCSVSPLDPVKDPSCPEETPSGRFDTALSVAVDFYGNEYVASSPAGDGNRIDIFDDEGKFISELLTPLGDPVSMAVDSVGNLYVIEVVNDGTTDFVRYSPTVYEPEAGNIVYGNPRAVVEANPASNAGMTIDPTTDRLYVSWGNSITEYGSAAEGNKALNVITHEKLNWTLMLAVDGDRRRLFASSCKDGISDCRVLVFSLDPPYTLLEEIDGSTTPIGDFLSTKGWLSTAVNEETGHFFIADLETGTRRIHEFDESYGYVSSISSSGFQGGRPLQIAFNNSPLDKAALNRHFLFVPNPLAAGRALAFSPPAESAPIVESSTATDIGEQGAELQAIVKPQGGDTTYVFKYVTEEEFDEEGFANATVAKEGTISKESQPTLVTANLSGLSPGTTYRFLVVATNKKGSDEEAGLFATYSDASPDPDPGICPNQTFRIGFSSSLPDCRAYELVTPPDTNGRPTKGVGFSGDRFTTLEVSPLGTAVSFNTEGGSLPGLQGAGGYNGDLYRSSRSESGWSTVSASPSGTDTNNPAVGSPSPDQGYSFWGAGGEGTAVVGGRFTHYIRYPDSHSELVGRGSLGSDPSAIGKLITAGGGHIVFQTQNLTGVLAQQLEPNAPPPGTEAVYDRTIDPATGSEKTHVVSLLPGDLPPPAGQDADYLGASADGEGIAFELEGGTLYLRKNNAVTYEIGKNVTFAGVSEGGERIFYVESGDLYAFDASTEEVIAFTSVGNATPVNVAPDGTRAYFVTTSVIPGGGQNPNGAFAKAGQQNLYLSEEGNITFVATVTARDVEGEIDGVGARVDGLGLWTEVHATQPAKDPSRLTPDGSVLLFQSRANLAGYDPGGFAQIYRYDDVAGRLHCISCIPTKAAAAGGASLETFAAFKDSPPPFTPYAFVPNLRADGQRAFFESKEALVSTDTNGVQDVYEWEEQNVGSCDRAGGCIYLITSGQSARDNYLYGISATGDDVFFITEDVLVSGDNDTASIYDARVGGGFPEASKQVCVGEGCRPTLLPLPAQIEPERPAQGNENFTPRKCPKGKRKVKRGGKVRCVKKKQRKHKQRRAGTRRGGAK